ncbi:DUF4153 domain-containing protein [Paenibacillus elgii]|uniref:DUF4153 domain-containing protein n=1 Tax=Paenibacillus elgii TaxID=189691 RepID=UPI00203DA232|nr:DUF4173 domain-containing protein [Paenibacillus elgii]MCM3267556.1 DUF4173 domain-containing protein [Paenibacillus elgii]
MKTESVPVRYEGKLLLAALGCAVVHHYLFYGKAWGVSFPLFVILFYVYYYWAVREKRELRLEPSMALAVPVLLLSFTYVAHSNLLLLVFNALAVPLLIVAHTTWHMAEERPKTPFILRLLDQVFVQTIRYVPRPAIVAFQALSFKMKAGRSQELMKVLIGLVVSIPLLLAVVALLASADSMFDRALARLPELTSGLELGQTLFRALWIACIATGLFAYVRGLLHPKRWPPRAAEEDFDTGSEPPETNQATIPATTPAAAVAPSAVPRLDATVAATVLVVLNAVYLLFAFVQFSYFFGGGAAELPEGITYASYARKGFAELVVVTLINLTVLMIMLYGVKRPGPAAWRFLRSLLGVLVGCTGIMLSSAYLRLSMYEEAYGYTVARLLVHAFMLFLLVLFILALVKLWRERLPLLRCYAVVTVIAYVIVNYFGIDAAVTRGNIQRYEATGRLDAAYLGSLGYEVVPLLLELKRKHPAAEGVDEALQSFRSRIESGKPGSWTEFNWSEWRAAKALEEQ